MTYALLNPPLEWTNYLLHGTGFTQAPYTLWPMNFGTALAYYTCVFEYKGGTYIRQFRKEDFPAGVSYAITDVLRFLECPVTAPAEIADVEECWRGLVALEGVEGVWCSSILAHNALFEVLVIRQ